jgi:hypothetical protein
MIITSGVKSLYNEALILAFGRKKQNETHLVQRNAEPHHFCAASAPTLLDRKAKTVQTN